MDLSLALFLGWLALTLALLVTLSVWLFRPDAARQPLRGLAVVWVGATVVMALTSSRAFRFQRTHRSGRPAPAFALRTLDGTVLTPEQLRGKVVLLEFWATWCPPCRESLPEMMQLYREFSGPGFQIIGISEDHSQEQLESFVAQQGIRWPQVWDADGRIADQFRMAAVPSYCVLGPEGSIRFEQRGWNPETMQRLRDVIRSTLTETAMGQPAGL